MEKKKGSEFILVKKESGGCILINTSHITKVEKYNNVSKLFLSNGSEFFTKHSFNSFVSRLNVIDMEDDI